MGFKPWRVLLCLETLTDVFLHPDLNHKSARGKNKQPGKEIRNLQKLIESGKFSFTCYRGAWQESGCQKCRKIA
jgi:hypothetical protein